MNRENLDDLTIVCPTYNRPHMLKRTLKYYKNNNFSCKIIIADSSDDIASKIVKETLIEFCDSINVEYIKMPSDTEFGQKLYESTSCIKTKYTIIIPDDDLVIKSALIKSMEELDSDLSISAIYGNRLSISSISEPDNDLEWVHSFPFYSVTIDQEDPINRVRRLPVPSWWQFPYAVCRTKILSKSLHTIRDMKYTQFTEFFFYSAILSYGKWIKMDCLFALCNSDSEHYSLRDRDSFKHYWGEFGSIMAQISQPFWSSHILTLSERVARLTLKDEFKVNEFSITLRKIYFAINNQYLEQNGLSDYLLDNNQFIAKVFNRIRVRILNIFWIICLSDRNGGLQTWIRMIKGIFLEIISGKIIKFMALDFTWIRFKSLIISIKRTGSLDYEIQSLINPKSRFHNDFIHAFEAWRENPCPAKYDPKVLKS